MENQSYVNIFHICIIQCDTTSQCHLRSAKIRTSRFASCLCVVFRWASQPRPSITQAFTAMLLADRCLQANPAVWHNVKYSLLKLSSQSWFGTLPGIHSREVLHPPQHPQLQKHPNQINDLSSSQSRIRQTYFNLSAT